MDFHLHPHCHGSEIPGPYTYCIRAPGKVKYFGRGFTCPLQGETCFRSPLSLRSPAVWWWEGGGIHCFMWSGQWVHLRCSKAQLHHSVSSSDSLMHLSLSTLSLSSGVRLYRSPTWSYLTQLLSLLPWEQCQAPSFPAAWDLDSCMVSWALHLGCPILSSVHRESKFCPNKRLSSITEGEDHQLR